jgi:hypothetical protein
VVVRWRPDDDWMYYGSITTGYKSGGFGSFSIDPPGDFATTVGLTNDDARPDAFAPEEVISYELGLKGKLLEGRASWELIGYYYTYEDLQVTVGGPGIFVENLGEVDGWGVESTFNVLVNDYVDLFLSAAWADTEISDVQVACGSVAEPSDECEGNSLPQLPKFSYSAVLQGRLPAHLLDGMAGLWCVNVGYGRAELIEAAQRQMQELPYYNTFFKTTTPVIAELAADLAALTPTGSTGSSSPTPAPRPTTPTSAWRAPTGPAWASRSAAPSSAGTMPITAPPSPRRASPGSRRCTTFPACPCPTSTMRPPPSGGPKAAR